MITRWIWLMLLVGGLIGVGQVKAQMPSYSASPSAIPTVTKGASMPLKINLFPKSASTAANLPLVNNPGSNCDEVMVVGDKQGPPVNITVTVKGSGTISGYRVTYSDGTSEDKVTPVFTKVYTTPGTFEVKGFVKDTVGNYNGGTALCRKPVYIYTAPMTSQPQTGVEMGVWVAIMAALFSGLGLWRLAEQRVTKK